MATRDEPRPLTPEQIGMVVAGLDLAAGELVAVMNGLLGKVHRGSQCDGEHCWVHNPSDHHMATWPIYWNAGSRTALRVCSHNFGHPDPDDIAYNADLGVDVSEHECDGCCAAAA